MTERMIIGATVRSDGFSTDNYGGIPDSERKLKLNPREREGIVGGLILQDNEIELVRSVYTVRMHSAGCSLTLHKQLVGNLKLCSLARDVDKNIRQYLRSIEYLCFYTEI